MTDPSRLRWAPPTRADDPDWADLLAAIEAVDHFGEAYGPEELEEEWESVTAHPDTDSVFVWDGPQLVAFGWLKTEVGTVKDHRLLLWGGVRPSHRRQGIGTAVLDWLMARARVVAAGFDPARAAVVRVDMEQDQADRIALVQAAGFEPVRHFLDMARPTSRPVQPVGPTPGLELVPWRDELEEMARLAHDDAFLDHWGSQPRSAEEWRQSFAGNRHFRPDLSVLALDPERGDVAGLVLVAAYPTDWEQGISPVDAWITSVATRRPWRGRGVATWLVTEVLARIRDSETSFERAMLGVDAENPTGALRVYERLGFTPVGGLVTCTAKL